MHGLVVGRFQPLHRGHEKVVQAAIEDCVHVTVGIGSSQAKESVQNPFSYDERVRMVRAAFGDQVEVVALPDIHDPPNWVDHVLSITGPVDRVFGNDDTTLNLFEDANIPVRRTGLHDRDRHEGRSLRLQIAEDDAAWRKAVSPPVLVVLEDIDAGKRIRILEARTA